VQTYEISQVDLVESPTAVVRATLTVAQLGPWLAQAYGAVAAYLSVHGAGPVGMPFARYHPLGGDRFEVEAGFGATREVAGAGQVVASRLPGGPAVKTWHVGPYDALAGAYEAVEAWVREHGGTPAGDPWEIYHSDAVTEPDPASWRTEVVAPYRPDG
jgi:effector-binding domain-containing protein